MKKQLVMLAICLVAITGCGSTGSDKTAAPVQETTQARADLSVSNAATCQTLMGSDGGLVSETARFLTDVDELSDSNAKKAEELAGALDGIASTSSEELRKLLIVMQEPFRDLADAHKTGKSFQLNPARFKAAGNEVVSICEKASAPTAGAEPSPTNELNQKATEKSAANRYVISCGDSKTAKFTSLKDVWASGHYKAGDTCKSDFVGYSASPDFQLLPNEQSVVDIVASKGGDVTKPAAAFVRTLTLCTKLPYGWENTIAPNPVGQMADAAGAITLCPEAPHAATLQDAATVPKIGDGTKIVGTSMAPGTWQTKPGVKDCYWSRSTGGGDIIDNNFVGFAAEGVTVTVYPGEGFESSRCGVWRKIG